MQNLGRSLGGRSLGWAKDGLLALYVLQILNLLIFNACCIRWGVTENLNETQSQTTTTSECNGEQIVDNNSYEHFERAQRRNREDKEAQL